MKLFIITLFFTLCSINYSYSQSELSETQLLKLKTIATDLIKSTHQSLEKGEMRLNFYTIKKADYFMESNFTLGRVFLGRPHYRIGVNPIIFKLGISDEALMGVMAHELVHTEDYRSGTTIGGLIPIGLKVSLRKSRIQYERKTDFKVILKGLGPQLRAYRLWQYQQLSAQDLVEKRKEYLSVEEIEFLEELRLVDDIEIDELIKRWLEKRIPTSLEAFKREYLKINSQESE